jgi:hypothetical protein
MVMRMHCEINPKVFPVFSPFHKIRNLFLPTRNVLSLKAVEFRDSLRPYRPMIVDHK